VRSLNVLQRHGRVVSSCCFMFTSLHISGVLFQTHFYVDLLSRRSRQQERLSASMLSICSSVCLSVSLSVAKMQKTRFSQKLSSLELWCQLTTYRKLCNWTFQRTHYWTLKSKMAEIRHLENRHDIICFCRGWFDWIKFRRPMQNDMSTAVMWSKSNQM